LEKKIKYGVIGVGHLGNFHVKQLLNIDDVELIGIYDTNQQRLDEISLEYKINKYDSLNQLLQSADAVSVVTPTTLHKDIALLALKNNCHVFIEKPIAHTLDAANAIIREASEYNKVIHVGHIERFNPVFKKFNENKHHPLFIECHRLSKLSNRSMDISVILDLMIHDIDLILHMIDSSIINIVADGINVVSQSVDLANVKISFKNGAVVNLTASRISNKNMRKIRLFENNCYTSLDLMDHKLSKHYAEFSQSKNKLNFKSEDVSIEKYDALREELRHFCKAIINNDISLSNANISAKALEVAIKINNIIKSKYKK